MKAKITEDQGTVILYRSEDGKTAVEVKLKEDTVWLSQAQMADLFQRNQSVVSRHIRNIFEEGELSQKSNMQKMHIANSDKPAVFYSLDVIISLGYRVKSKRGTLFRIWATRVIKDHLINGYSLNQKRLHERQASGLKELHSAIELARTVSGGKALTGNEGKGLLDVITRYAKSWLLLQQYDEDRLAVPGKSDTVPVALHYPDAREAIAALTKDLKVRGAVTDLFGRERGDALAGILGSLEQTFDGRPLYPNVEAKAAHLLYFIIKDHPFIDGNKRIGSLLFIPNSAIENSIEQ